LFRLGVTALGRFDEVAYAAMFQVVPADGSATFRGPLAVKDSLPGEKDGLQSGVAYAPCSNERVKHSSADRS
jgi:hypothetical protein